MVRRNTIQKEIVLQTVRNLQSHVSADEVYEEIIKSHPSIGKGTVYRNLAILAEEGEIRRVEISNAADVYDFTLENHYHVRCVTCNSVCDVDMEVIPDLLKKIKDTHGIEFLDCDILFKGVCPNCQGNA